MRALITFLLCSILINKIQAQHTVNGKVSTLNDKGSLEYLFGAEVYWDGSNIGVYTDEKGKFSIEHNHDYHKLIISFAGFNPDTLLINGHDDLEKFYDVQLTKGKLLDEVEVVVEKNTTSIDYINPKKIENISQGELRKAACCNLSESFETSPSVDVSFTDAVTGTRQIQMLGLAGTYSQITSENMPDVRGLSAITGLQFIPGAWIRGIQLNKGAGTVINGFESITGQINVDLRHPEDEEKAHVNLYSNLMGRVEGNYIVRHKFNDKVKATFLLHNHHLLKANDKNNDNFTDNLVGDGYTGVYRIKYRTDNGFEGQLAFRGLYDDKTSGQFKLVPEDPYQIRMISRISEVWGKTGYLFKSNDFASVGFQYKALRQEVDYSFGNRIYKGLQQSGYANLIYQNIIKNSNNNISIGGSFVYDNFDELLEGNQYVREEIVPGAFAEYTHNHGHKWDIVLGLRGDYHNYYGLFATPRIHLRYEILENTVLRASAGRGLKSVNPFAENFGVLATSRNIIIHESNPDMPYGLNPEIAWNGGLNLTQHFFINYKEMTWAFDFYRSQFEDQLIVDYDQSAREVHFYNLDGESFANSFQVQMDYELTKRFDIRMAYRYFDVKSTYNGELLVKPLLASNRAFVNLSYDSRNHWIFDYTLHWQGEKRVPSTMENPEEYRRPEVSPSFFLMNAQISKKWRERFELALGCENILNFKQDNPIIASGDPNGEYFDSSLVWGPVFGRNIYLSFKMDVL